VSRRRLDEGGQILGWSRKFDTLETIIDTAWTWHRKSVSET
jgi:UDP-glucose 4-epimerase